MSRAWMRLRSSSTALILNHVLEHVARPDLILRQVQRILAPRGRLSISVPHYRRWIARAMGSHWMGWLQQQYVWHFIPRTLLGIVQRDTTLRSVEVTTAGRIAPPSKGARGMVRESVGAAGGPAGMGDQIEAVLQNHKGP